LNFLINGPKIIISSPLTVVYFGWDNRAYVRQQQKVNLMNTFNNKISKLILEACEELLPKTTEANNAKIKKALQLARKQIESSEV
jgi:hypothetical protein